MAAYCLERSVVDQRKVHDDAGWVFDRDEMRGRLAALPAATFPYTTRHADELTAGEGHDRFDFTVDLLIDGLAHRESDAARRLPPAAHDRVSQEWPRGGSSSAGRAADS